MGTATRETAAEAASPPTRRRPGEVVEAWWGRAERAVEPLRARRADPVAYDPADPAVRRRFWQLAITGFLGCAVLFAGASQPSSPFTEGFVGYTGNATPAWFFGLRQSSILLYRTPPPGTDFYLSLACFYGGLLLLMQAWVRLARLCRDHPGVPLRRVAAVAAAWALPMLVVAPLLSKDAYSYVAQGEMMSRHISPYRYGPGVLGVGANSYTSLTDKLWVWTTSPYGPLFLWLAGAGQSLVGHSELGGLVAMRVVAVVGVVLIGVFVPLLARAFGRDGAQAFVFGVANPIVLVHLIGGEHNDALMLGLMVAGLYLAQRRHPVLGVVLVALAALVKVPAALGVVYIGWEWAGARARPVERVRTLVAAGLVALGVMAVVTEAVGIGWGFVNGLTNPDAVRSYLDPATGLGLGLAALVHLAGLGEHSHLFLTLTRSAGALGAAAIGARLLWRSEPGWSAERALGLTMLAVVLLGPVLQPWYVAWGVVLLAPGAEGRLRGALIWLTVVVTFLGLGDAQYLVLELDKANKVIVGVGGAGLLALLLAPLWPTVRRAVALRRGRAALAAEGS